jgi:transcriptional regulator with XRE-family HTH domain
MREGVVDVKDIGARIRELRLAKGLSQGDVERGTGLLRCYLSRLENNHGRPTLETLERLAPVLGVAMSQFFVTLAPEERGSCLPPEDLDFLIQVNRASAKLNDRQREWLLEMVKKFATKLGDGKTPPAKAGLEGRLV